ncbi:MAG TPA: hydrolase 1, exosortase A system-associated, partial [Burkholderiaceae bacterium]|nr:hydrolase 1, exosortase A system-associated [Burkholderiaceae bacterium]
GHDAASLLHRTMNTPVKIDTCLAEGGALLYESPGIDESLLVIGPAAGGPAEGGPANPELLGVLSRPADPQLRKSVGLVIVVGGPQTRVGSHRQFVLMARALARAGYPCLRFDYTGMGDSPGPKPDFETAGPDIRRACDALLDAEPACRRIALWGLCDGASAAVFHALADERVAAVIAANPWARSEATRAAAIVSEHYGSRLRSAEFWKKLATGKIDVFATAREALGHAWRARASRTGTADGSPGAGAGQAACEPSIPDQRKGPDGRRIRAVDEIGGRVRLRSS